MTKLALSIPAIVVLSTSLAAQASTTIPLGFDKTEGTYSRHIPLRYTPARIQCGYDAKSTGWANKVINQLEARADGTRKLTTGFSVVMQVLLSSKGADPTTASMVFKNNHGGDVQVFMAKKTYKFAPFSAPTTPPAPWLIVIKGDKPFVATTGSLVVDWATYTDAKNTSMTNSDFYVDAARVSGTPKGTRGTASYYGTACNPTNFYNYATAMDIGSEFRTYGYTRNLGDFHFCWLGASKTSTAVPGLTGCTLYTSPVVFHPLINKTTSTSGYTNFVWGKVPAFMKGKKVYNQQAAVNAKGAVRFSRGAEITFGDYALVYPNMISHKYNYGSGTSNIFNPDKDDARYGWIDTAIIFNVK